MTDTHIHRLGLMGGTFDPIHYGHLMAAAAALRHFQLDQILFLPTGRPPHKRGQHTATPQQRYEMTLLAVGGQPDFRVSALETNRQGYSYTWDTLQYFREEFPQSQLFFITGADAILDISSWKNAHQLTKLCTFIAIARPGFDLAGLSRLPMQISRHIQSLKVPALAISSTEIREKIHNGHSANWLTTPAVLSYINNNGLYRN